MSFLAISALKSTSAYERGWVILGAPSSWSLGTEGLAAAEILKPSRVVEALTSKTRSSAEEVLRSVRVFKVTFIVSRERLSVVAKEEDASESAGGRAAWTGDGASPVVVITNVIVSSRTIRRERDAVGVGWMRERGETPRRDEIEAKHRKTWRGVPCVSEATGASVVRSGVALGECRSDTACANSDEAIFTK